MSTLLRHPGVVPALFSSEAEPAPLPLPAWRRLVADGRLLAVAGWAAVMLIDVPLVRAATTAAGLALPK